MLEKVEEFSCLWRWEIYRISEEGTEEFLIVWEKCRFQCRCSLDYSTQQKLHEIFLSIWVAKHAGRVGQK